MSHNTDYTIRKEHIEDICAISSLTTTAFKSQPHSGGNEAAIVNKSREHDQLTVSLVAVSCNEVIGHVAFSTITIDGSRSEWYGLGQISVATEYQRQGIGSALVRHGIECLRQTGAKGCVLLGDPAFYQRFGFKCSPRLTFEGAPAEHFMALSLDGEQSPEGTIEFRREFAAA